MKILYPNRNILDIRCDDRDNTKEQCSCLSIEVPPKTEWFVKKKEKQHKGYYRDFWWLLACLSVMGNLKDNLKQER